jgi:hypothetical protein
VNDELENMWKKAIVAKFKMPSWHLPGGTVKTGKPSG